MQNEPKKVMEVEIVLKIIMEKSWNFSTAYHESRSALNNKTATVIWLWEAFSLRSKFRIVMLGSRQTIFSTLYLQFEKRFYFIFLIYVILYVMNMRDDRLCLPFRHHGKQRKLSWKRRGNLLSDFWVWRRRRLRQEMLNEDGTEPGIVVCHAKYTSILSFSNMDFLLALQYRFHPTNCKKLLQEIYNVQLVLKIPPRIGSIMQ